MEAMNNYFQTQFTFDPRRNAVWKEVCRFLQKRYIPMESRILDLGAGYGDFINNIHGSEKHALDIESNISKCVRKNVFTHVRSCTAMDNFSESFFGIIFASNVFEHLTREQLLTTLDELRRILRSGGKLLIIQPNFKYCCKDYFDDYTHLQIFTHIGLCNLLVAAGFGIIDVKPRFLPFSMKSNLPKSPMLVRLYLRLPFKPCAGQMLIVAENRK